MRKILAFSLIMLASLLAVPNSTHPAHAGGFTGTGLVCLARPTSTNCPQVPLTFNATTGKNFAIGVFINNSQPMLGFDIYVKVDTAILNPTGANLGNLIVSPTSTIICVNGQNIVGVCSANSANGPGVVEVGTQESTGSNECAGTPPCSGMAFIITYTAVGSTASSPFSYPTSTPTCLVSSISSPPNVCVLVTDNLGNTLPENTQAADFANQSPSANFVATPATGPVPLVVSFDGSASNATKGHSITNYIWNFGDGSPMANITTGPTISHTYVTPENFAPSLETIDSGGARSIVKDTLIINVLCSFVCASPNNLKVISGTNATSTITLTGIVPFNGTITLSQQVSPAGPVTGLNVSSVTLSPGKTARAKLEFNTTLLTPVGTYNVNVTGTAKTVHYSVIVTFVVTLPDFGISASPPILTLSQGGNSASTITLTSKSNFNGTVTLSATNSSKYVLGFLSSSSLKLISTSGTNSSTLYVLVQSGTPSKSYNITLTGTSPEGTLLLTHKFNVTVTVPPPNFSLSATLTSVSVKASANATSAITFTGLNGFSDNITLQAKNPPGVGITTVFSPSRISINSTSGPETSAVIITTLGTTPAGTYRITVNGTAVSLHIQHFLSINVTVISPLPTVQVGSASLSTLSVTAGKPVTLSMTVSNTGSVSANITVTMDVNSGGGANITVAQQTVTLSPGQAAQTFTLSWNTTQWQAGSYHVYARVIGSQTSSVNQAQSAGTVSLSSPPPGPSGLDFGFVPWITTGIAAAVAVVFGLLLFKRRAPFSKEAA